MQRITVTPPIISGMQRITMPALCLEFDDAAVEFGTYSVQRQCLEFLLCSPRRRPFSTVECRRIRGAFGGGEDILLCMPSALSLALVV
mmetsp:Transcript_23900/g.80712  ORF Transcript_23900/g.80712 Transcript_23900/m.80712 type:complete len:88 (+) Transcript_23900:249-512(+)